MKLLRFPEVAERVRLGKTAIYRQIKAKAFPLPIKQGSSSFWIEHEIDQHLVRLMSERPASQPMPAS